MRADVKPLPPHIAVMATLQEASAQWKTTIIVSASLGSHEVCRQLGALQHRIRFSESVESRIFVFPLSGIAFLLLDLEELAEPFEEAQLVEQITKFVKIHRNCFLLLHDPFNKRKEVRTLIQNRFFGSSLRILPVHNNPEIVKGMLTIAKATSKPHVDKIRDRLSMGRACIIENSPVWEMLKEII